MRMAESLAVSCNITWSSSLAVIISPVLDDTGSATENEGDEEDDLDLNSDVVAALLDDGNSEDGQVNDDGNDSWEDIDIQEENL